MKIKTKYLLAISAAAFLVGTVFLAIETATSGAQLAAFEKEESRLSDGNRELSDKILQVSSLSEIEKKAGELTFAKPEKVVYFGAEESIAKVP